MTRPPPGLTATAQALRTAGHEVIEAPVLEVASVSPRPVPDLPWPDWVVLVSANAARGLAAAVGTIGARTAGSRFAAVGARTAEVARALGFEVTVVPADQRAEGLLAALGDEPLHGRRVWIPAGDRPGSATRDLPAALEARGATVQVFRVYATRERSLTEEELGALTCCDRATYVVHSPSAAEAIFRDPSPAVVGAWRERAVAVAIGPVTRVRLEELGVNRIVEAPEPSDAGVVAALAALEEREA